MSDNDELRRYQILTMILILLSMISFLVYRIEKLEDRVEKLEKQIEEGDLLRMQESDQIQRHPAKRTVPDVAGISDQQERVLRDPVYPDQRSDLSGLRGGDNRIMKTDIPKLREWVDIVKREKGEKIFWYMTGNDLDYLLTPILNELESLRNDDVESMKKELEVLRSYVNRDKKNE